jgi:hypothetical protein
MVRDKTHTHIFFQFFLIELFFFLLGALGYYDKRNELYLINGETSPPTSPATQYGQVWKFDLATATWTEKTQKTPTSEWITPFADMASASYGNYIFMQGGDDNTTDRCLLAPATKTRRQFVIYNMKTNEFKVETPEFGLPDLKRSAMEIVDLRPHDCLRLYLVGGYSFDASGQTSKTAPCVGTDYHKYIWTRCAF